MVLMSKYRLNKEPQRKDDDGRDANTYENVKIKLLRHLHHK